MSEAKPLLRDSGMQKPGSPGLMSRMFFWFPFYTLLRGYSNELEIDDLEPNSEKWDSGKLAYELEKSFEKARFIGSKTPLMSAFWKTYGNDFMLSGLLAFIRDGVIKIGQCLLFGRLLRAISNGQEPNMVYICVIALVLSMFLITFFYQHSYDIATEVALKLSAATSSLIYRKILRLSESSGRESGVGQVSNFLSTDLGMFVAGLTICHSVWIAPVVTLVSMIIVVDYVGFAGLAGLGISILTINAQTFASKWIGSLRVETAISTDRRLRLVKEVLRGIRLIKMATWEAAFIKLVTKAREEEIRLLKKRSVRNAMLVSVLQVSPRLALFVTLAIYMFQGNTLDPETGFVVFVLFRAVTRMSSLLQSGILYASEMRVSVKRIEAFLAVTEIVKDETAWQPTDGNGPIGLRLASTSTRWTLEGDNILQDFSLEVAEGNFVCILGPVGAGKSTMLSMILKEIPITFGSLDVVGRVAFTAQDPCLFPGSVRENILGNNAWDHVWYDEVIDACALRRDLELFPYGDCTLVGGNGVTLSGGQRARISLARAVYHNADVYLLDDPLSSVDATVGAHIFAKCIRGLLRAKCVIMITHLPHHARDADEVILLDKGITKSKGTFHKLHSQGLISSIVGDNVDDLTKDVEEVRRATLGPKFRPEEEDEKKMEGSVGLELCWKFLRAGNHITGICLLILIFLISQIVSVYADFFLEAWITADSTAPATQKYQIGKDYAYGYSVLLAPLLVLPFAHACGHYWACLRSCRRLHASLFKAVIRAPIRFFEVNSMGRTLNRFSKDMGTADLGLQLTLYTVLLYTFATLGTLAIVSITNPVFIFPSVVLLCIIYFMRKFYLRGASRIARLEITAKSPVLDHVNSTLHGLTTIRAFKMEPKFMQNFDFLQNCYLRAAFAQQHAIRWVGSMVQLATFLYFALVTFSLVFGNYDASAVGLVISSTFDTSGIISYLIVQSGMIVNELVSVERILEYTQVLPQQNSIGAAIYPPLSWPTNGAVQFDRVRVSYFTGKDVLREISCRIRAREKVGIVGRTGAGKSTLVAAFFRMVELSSGSIHIDGLDISRLDLRELRRKLAIIPQDPTLFAGTLRMNLDPLCKFNDTDLRRVIQEAQLTLRLGDDGLEAPVAEQGSNFSQGERQLIALARALLQRARILILDEATAHVDSDTDELIQLIVREKFRDCTVITIAHRLSTILDSDRVCVMEAGEIVEFDTPSTLLADPRSNLSQLYNKASASTVCHF